jgi:hypothetical protein
MKLATDKCRRENTKTKKELAIFYKRFIIYAEEKVIPQFLADIYP